MTVKKKKKKKKKKIAITDSTECFCAHFKLHQNDTIPDRKYILWVKKKKKKKKKRKKKILSE